ncbi:hypothetical protein CEP54_015194 [Fusarium duplospermum]|uniref:Uncharacterized protein n=1 Tax=Fusarium duplospermum TaxID=1325734 RepID=A0A428NR02_9HYPO|nr:hypothetical protein CEP54_015194 [Fusarium duplospermum]
MTGRKLSDPGEGPRPKKSKTETEIETDEAQNQSKTKAASSCARWCEIKPDGTFSLDETKIKSSLSQEELENVNRMHDVLQGRVLSGQICPLIFDTSLPDAPETVRLRTLSFFSELLEDLQGVSKYQALTPGQRKIIAVGIRDLYIAEAAGMLQQPEKVILQGMIGLIDEDLGVRQLGGLNISYYPSNEFSITKFVENLDEKIGKQASELYAQIIPTPKLFAVFVNPADLSYHNFENIIHLDSWFESNMSSVRPEQALSLKNGKQTTPDREVFTCDLQGDLLTPLKVLSELDLYVPPLNKTTRGGDRFIFHSSILSQVLTEALQSSDILDKLSGGQLKSSFEFVNYVFRCNRFNTDDSHFQSHLDTPYYDSSRSQISKYTMLINLTTGHNDPALRIEDVLFHEVQEFTCTIFDQKYEHEGWPFSDGQKVFIRTELVFRDGQLEHKNEIAGLFAEACYMSWQSIFDQGLSSYANECFERANSLHWALPRAATRSPVYLSKEFQGLRFLTNGYNYWFLKSEGVTLKECALVAVLDYFNCKIGQKPFQSLVSSTKIERRFEGTEEIWPLLTTAAKVKGKTGIRHLKKTDVESLIKTGPGKPLEWQLEDWDGEPEELEEFPEDGDGCCPMHSFPMFNPWKNNEIMDAYEACCDYSLKKLFGAPLLILDQEIVINGENIKVVNDKVFFLRSKDGKPLPRINFAACWNDDTLPSEYVLVGEEIEAPDIIVPPLTFHEFTEGYQFSLDFFRNDWMVKADEQTIPLPDVSERPEPDGEFRIRVDDPSEKMQQLFDHPFGE